MISTNSLAINSKIFLKSNLFNLKPKFAISNEKNWQLEIPKIDLVAKISEGVEMENLDCYVGHFEETHLVFGNVVLAAHNRGYKVNYFSRIKELEEGDLIIYRCGKIENKYEVVEERIIFDTNVNILQETKDNRITLITCVENIPNQRRVIIGFLKNRKEIYE